MSRNPAGDPGEPGTPHGSERPPIVDLDFLRELIAAAWLPATPAA